MYQDFIVVVKCGLCTDGDCCVCVFVDSGSSNHQSSVNLSTDSKQRSARDFHVTAVAQRNQRHDSDSDQDIPRRSEQRKDDSDPDLSLSLIHI